MSTEMASSSVASRTGPSRSPCGDSRARPIASQDRRRAHEPPREGGAPAADRPGCANDDDEDDDDTTTETDGGAVKQPPWLGRAASADRESESRRASWAEVLRGRSKKGALFLFVASPASPNSSRPCAFTTARCADGSRPGRASRRRSLYSTSGWTDRRAYVATDDDIAAVVTGLFSDDARAAALLDEELGVLDGATLKKLLVR